MFCHNIDLLDTFIVSGETVVGFVIIYFLSWHITMHKQIASTFSSSVILSMKFYVVNFLLVALASVWWNQVSPQISKS